MVEYRELRADETSEAVALWSEVFRLEPTFFTSLLDGGAGDDVSLAALEEGRIVSSVHVFMRRVRDRDGRPLKVGGIGSVSTHPDHRKQGHSGRLLEMSIAAMEREGCVWSLLGTGVNDHYARYGWRTVSTPETEGEPYKHFNAEATILSLDDTTLNAMARVYEESTAGRPMATVRSERAWRTAIRYRLSGESLILGSHVAGGRLTAYVVARQSWGRWAFVEAEGVPARFSKLVAAGMARLRDQGVERVGASLHEGPALDAFRVVANPAMSAESRGTMLRPIADRIAWPDLLALYGDPRGRHGDLDAF